MSDASITVVALLDRPSATSYGMVPFVAEHRDGSLRIHGLQGQLGKRLDRYRLDRLVQEGYALRVNLTVEEQPGVWLAGWVGDEFRKRANAAHAAMTLVPTADQLTPTTGGGGFWIAPAAAIHKRLQRWLKDAGLEVFKRDNQQVAALMSWVLPTDQLTWAARWHGSATPDAKAKELRWRARLERDAGRSGDETILERKFEDIRDRFQQVVQLQFDGARRDSHVLSRRADHVPFFDPLIAQFGS